MALCAFCFEPVNADDPETYHEVRSWVNGPKLDGPKLREQTSRLAHKSCIDKLVAGQAPDQEGLFDGPSMGGNGDSECTCGTKPHREECPRFGRK